MTNQVSVHGYLFLILLLMGFSNSPASAQVDSAKALVGKWAGSIQAPTASLDRTLVIQSVTPKDGGWVAEGRFGGTGKKGRPVTIQISIQGGTPVLEFETPQNTPVHLKLVGENKLEGWVDAGRMERGGSIKNSFELQKAE